MDTSKLCYGCFGEHNGVGPCPRCGFDIATAKHPAIALPIGTILNGRYLTGRVLGVGGFGVTYLAMDMTLETAPRTSRRSLIPARRSSSMRPGSSPSSVRSRISLPCTISSERTVPRTSSWSISMVSIS